MLPNLHTARATQHYNMLIYWQLVQIGGGKIKNTVINRARRAYSTHHTPAMFVHRAA